MRIIQEEHDQFLQARLGSARRLLRACMGMFDGFAHLDPPRADRRSTHTSVHDALTTLFNNHGFAVRFVRPLSPGKHAALLVFARGGKRERTEKESAPPAAVFIWGNRGARGPANSNRAER